MYVLGFEPRKETIDTNSVHSAANKHLFKLLYIALISSLVSLAVVQDYGQSTVLGCACSTASAPHRLDTGISGMAYNSGETKQ